MSQDDSDNGASRHCYKCNAFRSTDGGSIILDAQRMKRWICAQCTARRKRPGSAPSPEASAPAAAR